MNTNRQICEIIVIYDYERRIRNESGYNPDVKQAH